MFFVLSINRNLCTQGEFIKPRKSVASKIENNLIIEIKVQPNANCNEIIGWENERLKIRICALPEKNKANKELIAFLAKTLRIPKSQMEIVQGGNSRIKRVKINNFSKNELLAIVG